jgi:hypothetical protein
MANTKSYTIIKGDENGQLRVMATNANTAKDTVRDVPPTLSVSISGSALEGSTLTATQTSDETEMVTYQWLRDVRAITAATRSIPTLIEADEDHPVSMRASLTEETSQTVTAASASTASVVDVAPTLSVSIRQDSQPEGDVLTATPAKIRDETAMVTYQWLCDARAIGGASGSIYTLVVADENHPVSVRASPQAVVEMEMVTYQWLFDGSAVTGAVGSTYALVEADEDHQVSVRA